MQLNELAKLLEKTYRQAIYTPPFTHPYEVQAELLLKELEKNNIGFGYIECQGKYSDTGECYCKWCFEREARNNRCSSCNGTRKHCIECNNDCQTCDAPFIVLPD